MPVKKHRLRRIAIIFGSVLLGIFILLVVFLSPLLKFLIEKYDEKFTGREIQLDWAYVNPLTGYVHLNDLKLFEQNKDSVFFSSAGISLKLNLSKLLKKEYEISYLSIDEPRATVVQYSKTKFNFTDILEKFSAKDSAVQTVKDTVKAKFSLLNVELNNGTFYLQDKVTPVHYFIKSVNIESSGLQWNVDTVYSKFSFESGIGSGLIEGNATMNIKNNDYRSHVIVRRLDLQIIEQYVRDLASFATFTAMINADITATGNLKEAQNVDAVGGIGIYNFHLGKTRDEDLASFDKFVMKIDHINPSKKLFLIDSVSLVHPYFKYQKYDHLDNIQMMFGKKGERVKEVAHSEKFNLVIEIARYVNKLAKNFLQSDYKINRVGVYRADLKYEDYSINEKFAVALEPLTFSIDSMNSRHRRVLMKVNSGIRPYGQMDVSLSINPQDSSDFELNYDFDKINASLINPYLTSFTSFPLDRGSVKLKGNWRVLNGEIRSNNNLLVIDPRISERDRKNNNKWIPMRFLMFFVRENGNAIDYEIPITGNLKDPKFHVKDVILDVLTNVFVKPATTPYRYEIRSVENDIEKTIAFNWQKGSAELLDGQQKFAEKIADFLKENKDASINVFPVNYSDKEKESIAFFEAKKKFYMQTNRRNDLSPEDSVALEKMSVRDSGLVREMRSVTKDQLLFTIQQLCKAYVGETQIEKHYKYVRDEREKHFLQIFSDAKVQDRVHMKKESSQVPFNGFSYYRVSYNGEIPPDMKNAFEELRQYDAENPRKKHQEERQKNRKFFKAR